jgi:hypothetical protein
MGNVLLCARNREPTSVEKGWGARAMRMSLANHSIRPVSERWTVMALCEVPLGGLDCVLRSFVVKQHTLFNASTAGLL